MFAVCVHEGFEFDLKQKFKLDSSYLAVNTTWGILPLWLQFLVLKTMFSLSQK